MDSRPSSNDNSYNFLILDKAGFYSTKPFDSPDKRDLEIAGATNLILSKDYFAIIVDGIVSIYLQNGMKLLKTLEWKQVSSIDFSPCNQFITIIQKPTIEAENLKIISTTDFQVRYSFRSTTHPTAIWPQIKYSLKGESIFKFTGDTIEISNIDSSSNKLIPVGEIKNVINFDISEIKEESLNIDEIAVICGRTLTSTGKTGKTTKRNVLSVFKLSDLDKPIIEKQISQCDRLKLKISPGKTSLLVNSISDDTSSSSYYGQSSLYFVDILYGTFNKLQLKDGPINDFVWLPNGQNFLVNSGHTPSVTELYNSKGGLVKELCKSKANTIRVSPDSRIAIVAGFGNLGGEIEFYNLSDGKVIGKTKYHGGGNVYWSEDSKYVVISVLSPRLRVDNEYKVFSYNGEILVKQSLNLESYEVAWVSDGKPYNEFKIEQSQEYVKLLAEQKTKPNEPQTYQEKLEARMKASSSNSIPGMGKKK